MTNKPPPKPPSKPFYKPLSKPAGLGGKPTKKRERPPRLKVERRVPASTPLSDDAARLAQRLKAVERGKLDPRKVLQLEPDDAPRFAALASGFLQNGDLETAIAAAELATTCDADHAPAWGTLGAALARAKREREAVVAYNHAARLAPEDLAVHVNLGELYLMLLDYQRASEELKLVLELDPKGETPEGVRAQALVAQTLLRLG